MRKTTKFLAAFWAILFLIPATEALAQRRRGLVDISPRSERHGLWFTIGAAAGADNYHYENGPGWNGVIGANGRREDQYAPTITLALGGTPNPHLRLGGEIDAWVWRYTDTTGVGYNYDVTESLVQALLVGQYYPATNLGLFLKGGLGFSRTGTDTYGASAGSYESGFGYLVGAGYEIRLGRRIFLTPAVTVMQHRSDAGGSLDEQGTLHERVVTFGVGLTVQPGR
jgi:hypothetical protein